LLEGSSGMVSLNDERDRERVRETARERDTYTKRE